jgi:CRP/FNR family transcriptional regulator, cyclic AMP receptor protein
VTGVAPSVLAGHAFLRGMPGEHVARLAEAAAEVSVPAGHRFFEEGGEAGQFWLIRTGHVALDLHIPGPARLIVETVGGGGVVGLSWLSPPRQWQFGAEAVQPTTAFVLNGEAVRALCDSYPVLGYQIIRRLMDVTATRLHATRIRMLDLYSVSSLHASAR